MARHIWTDDEIYAVYVEETNKSVARAKQINPNYKGGYLLDRAQLQEAIADKIDLIKKAGGRASGKNKLAKQLAHAYTSSQNKENITKYQKMISDLGGKQIGTKKLQYMSYKDMLRASGIDKKVEELDAYLKQQGKSSKERARMISIQIFGSEV